MIPLVKQRVIVKHKIYEDVELFKDSFKAKNGDKIITFYYSEIESYAN